MTVLQFLGYIQDKNILPTDTLVIVNAKGTAMGITTITRTGGTVHIQPPNPPVDVAPVVTIQLQ